MSRRPSSAPAPAPESPPESSVPFALAALEPTFTDPTPKIGHAPPFLFRHHPYAWHVVPDEESGGYVVIPRLAKLLLQAGVCNVRRDRSGAFDLRTAVFELRGRGWTVIPADCDGPGTSYVIEPMPGVFVTRWERIFPASDIVISDQRGWVAWCRSLVERGIVAPITIPAASKLVREIERDYQQAVEAAIDGKPSSVALRDRLRKQLDAALAALEVATARDRGAA